MAVPHKRGQHWTWYKISSLLDLRSWFRNNDVPSCQADLCPNEGCTIRIHKYCLNNLLSQRLGGLNSLIAMERSPAMPLVTQVPTIIVGMDVSHGSPGMSDGVSESLFNQVLNIELDQIMQFLDPTWNPKYTVIVAQKNHHTKFFKNGGPDNVPPGTIIDSKICHPRNNDFYLCAHAGMIGTSRPTHYHVLYDEIGFSTDDLQELVHSLSYVYQRSTSAISVVAPICYAHLAAAQMGTVMKFEDTSETSSSHDGGSRSGITIPGAVPVPPMPKLNDKVASSMFFC